MRIVRWLSGALSSIVIATSGAAYASEGAASYYFAGGFGSFLVAVPPEPGLTVASQTLMFGGQAQRAVLNGRQTFGLSAFAPALHQLQLRPWVGGGLLFPDDA
jgi:hypothetical protein